jgi:hypothetical protein
MVAAAAMTESIVSVERMPDHSSIFSVAAWAILLTLDSAEQSTYDQFVFFYDSLSCLQATQNWQLTNMPIVEIVREIHELIARGKNSSYVATQLCWSGRQLSGRRSRKSRA